MKKKRISIFTFELARNSKFKKYPVPEKKNKEKSKFLLIGYGKINDMFIYADYSILPTWEELIIEHRKGLIKLSNTVAKIWIKNSLEVPNNLIINLIDKRFDKILVGIQTPFLANELDFMYVDDFSDAFFLQKIC